MYREREKEREKERKNREKTNFFPFFLKKKLPPKKLKIKLKKWPGTRTQGSGALVSWYQGSHLSFLPCWGGGGREQETPGYVPDSSFCLRTTRVFKQTPFNGIYYILRSEGFILHHTLDHRERCPRSFMTSTNMCVVQVLTTQSRRPLPQSEVGEGSDVLYVILCVFVLQIILLWTGGET